MDPLFLLSLPRSGSTLLQRQLGSHPDITTLSEPWLLLPFLDVIDGERTFSIYDHGYIHQGIRGLIEQIEGGHAAYARTVGKMAEELYRQAVPTPTRWFLDKTPRYHAIAHHLPLAFPEAPFVVLVRHPLAVLASVIETFGKGNWYWFAHEIDLFEGWRNLARFYREHGDRCCLVQYEQLVQEPEAELSRIGDFLGIEGLADATGAFTKVQLAGMQDPTGTKQYRQVSREPLHKWHRTLGNRFRRAWARRYIQRLGADDLRLFGYDPEALLDEIEQLPAGLQGVAGDVTREIYGRWTRWSQGDVRRKLRRFPSNDRCVLR
ncbi:MAG: hypothetical protein COX57_09820 [Alphaproteobacteria bacterium CG_4_10_14_0_2_um_filter_63_37]|nr:MAG: hypothetical protein AUJ55_02765 [Proteobacteria bacterium CG1_02_64_396]PJA24174.1 MAG: hypothetical protein COX57_09820 [Alphaproteobacteria bacterium CG_4_10_14_0_2_um_filter_63_37]